MLPLRKIISDEMLLRYNAMQVDVFSLLAEARQRIASNTAAIAAERDFWLAEADLGAVDRRRVRRRGHHLPSTRHPVPRRIEAATNERGKQDIYRDADW